MSFGSNFQPSALQKDHEQVFNARYDALLRRQTCLRSHLPPLYNERRSLMGSLSHHPDVAEGSFSDPKFGIENRKPSIFRPLFADLDESSSSSSNDETKDYDKEFRILNNRRLLQDLEAANNDLDREIAELQRGNRHLKAKLNAGKATIVDLEDTWTSARMEALKEEAKRNKQDLEIRRGVLNTELMRGLPYEKVVEYMEILDVMLEKSAEAEAWERVKRVKRKVQDAEIQIGVMKTDLMLALPDEEKAKCMKILDAIMAETAHPEVRESMESMSDQGS
ncbi:MAG: hypothetical protein Q9166_007591 [cf. Caloplaca sp. 2 TL-2023]